MNRLGYLGFCALACLGINFFQPQATYAADLRIIKSDFVLPTSAYLKSGKKRETISCFRRPGSRLRLGIAYTKRGRKYLKDFSYRDKVVLNKKLIKRNDLLALCYLLTTASSSSAATSSSLSSSNSSMSSSVSSANSSLSSETSSSISSSSSSDSTSSQSSSSASMEWKPVCTLSDLDAVRYDSTAHYLQTCDIDFDGVQHWQPIGAGGRPFAGRFNGNGFVIKNYRPLPLEEDWLIQYGIFGEVQDATLENITITDSQFNSPPHSTATAGFLATGLSNTILHKITIKSATIFQEHPTTGGSIAIIAPYWENVTASDLVIKDVSIDCQEPTAPYNIDVAGVFGTATNVSLRDVEIDNILLRSGAGSVGALGITLNSPAKLENINIRGAVTTFNPGGQAAGLAPLVLAGALPGPIEIKSVSFTGTVDGKGDAGGLFSQLGVPAQVSHASFSGTVTAGTGNGAGGLAATAFGETDAQIVIRDSQVNGIVSASGEVLALGGIVGFGTNVNVETTTFNGEVHGGTSSVLGTKIGGIGGWLNQGALTRVASKGKLFGGIKSALVGGVAGSTMNTPVTDSYFEGEIFGEGALSGIAGLIASPFGAPIQNCYVGGGAIVAGPHTHSVNGLVGGGEISDVTSSYWDIERTGVVKSYAGVGKTHAEMLDPSTYAGWNFGSVWTIQIGSYPELR